MSEPPIRVAMCDDHDMVRSALAMVLDREPDIEIVAAVATGAELLDLAQRSTVDVAILDVRLKDESGVEVAQRLRVDHPDCSVIMLTSFESDSALVSAYEAGISAFLFKTGNADELVSAVRSAAMGLRTINPVAVRDALARIRTNGAELVEKLDDTDRRILRLLADGQSDKQIAESVFLSVQTVRNRVSRLLNRFGKENRTQLAVFVARVLPEASD
ncbi:MAG: response regulator transcription factor [Acidobacteria bacterium]|nr:response regulator transcription factor [Acidobacteriota bacterium]